MSAAPALAVEHLNASYGAAQVLFDVSFTVGQGEVVALMGRNGAGKSTTMKAVMGLLPRSGKVQVDGRDVSTLKPFEIARLGVGFTPEDRRIFSDLTVLENLDTGRQPPHLNADGTRSPLWTPEALFQLFPNLAELRHRLGSRISGGEQQMLAIARTLMGNPLILLLDEPSEGIAPLIVEKIADTIVELKQRGLSILLSEQNVGFAQIVSDRAYMLEKGQIRWEGAMADLTANTEIQSSYLAL